jgi:hypothetical protein
MSTEIGLMLQMTFCNGHHEDPKNTFRKYMYSTLIPDRSRDFSLCHHIQTISVAYAMSTSGSNLNGKAARM